MKINLSVNTVNQILITASTVTWPNDPNYVAPTPIPT